MLEYGGWQSVFFCIYTYFKRNNSYLCCVNSKLRPWLMDQRVDNLYYE